MGRNAKAPSRAAIFVSTLRTLPNWMNLFQAGMPPGTDPENSQEWQ